MPPIVGIIAAVVLAGMVAYAVSTDAMLGPMSRALDMWPVTIEERDDSVILARQDFDAIVQAHNRQRDEIIQLRLRSCP